MNGSFNVGTEKELEAIVVEPMDFVLYTRVEVKEYFRHCGKAWMRLKLWKPESRDTNHESLAARQFSCLLRDGGEEACRTTRDNLEELYEKVSY